jgi:phospholipid-binding lipoprotein MlaA
MQVNIMIRINKNISCVLAPVVFASLSACSVAPDGSSSHDPYETRNREVHAFNKSLNDSVSGGDEDASDAPLVHPDISAMVINFADNTSAPGMVLNGLLQGDIAGAATNTFRFVLNTTVGIGGLFDPADAIGLAEVDTDFGHTLSVWGVPEGAYLELPVLGPSTERDLAGRVVDMVVDPLGRYGTPAQNNAATVAGITARILKQDQYAETIDSVLNESADSYTQTKLIYLQNRRYELGLDAAEEIDPYADLYGE